MKGFDCGFCNGIGSMVQLNDDGVTYDVHLHTKDGEISLNVELETLKNLSDAISIQLMISDKRSIVPFEDID